MPGDIAYLPPPVRADGSAAHTAHPAAAPEDLAAEATSAHANYGAVWSAREHLRGGPTARIRSLLEFWVYRAFAREIFLERKHTHFTAERGQREPTAGQDG